MHIMLQSRSAAMCAGKFSGRHLAEFRLAETKGHYKFPRRIRNCLKNVTKPFKIPLITVFASEGVCLSLYGSFTSAWPGC